MYFLCFCFDLNILFLAKTLSTSTFLPATKGILSSQKNNLSDSKQVFSHNNHEQHDQTTANRLSVHNLTNKSNSISFSGVGSNNVCNSLRRTGGEDSFQRAKNRTLKMVIIIFILINYFLFTNFILRLLFSFLLFYYVGRRIQLQCLFIFYGMHLLLIGKLFFFYKIIILIFSLIPPLVRKFLYAFAVFNSAISPYLYGYFSFNIKEELRLLLYCCSASSCLSKCGCSKIGGCNNDCIIK